MGPMGLRGEEGERQQTSRLGGGKTTKNGLYKEISLRYRFFLEKGSYVLDGFIEYWDPYFFGDPLVLGIPLKPAGLIGIFVVAYYNPDHNWVV